MTADEYRGNIGKSYAASFLRAMIFIVPIITIFMLGNGLSMTQIFLLESYFSFVVILLEVPSGAFADAIGRKYLLIAGPVVLAVSSILFSAGSNFYHFIVAETIWAFGASMISGADVAIVYDTMKKLKKERKAKHALSNFVFFGLTGALTGSLISSFIIAADPTYRWAFALSSIPLILSSLVACTMKEPELYAKQKFSARKYYEDALEGVVNIRKNRRLFFLFINFAFLSALGRISFWLFQPYMKLAGIDVVYFGFVFMAFAAVGALSAKAAPLYDKLLGKKNAVISFSLLQGFAFLGMSLLLNPVAAIALMLAVEIVWGASYPLFSAYAHKYIKSEQRATLDSVGSTMANIIFLVLGPLFGFISDNYSMQTAFVIMCVVIVSQMVLFKIEED